MLKIWISKKFRTFSLNFSEEEFLMIATTNPSIRFQLLENFPVYNQECVCIEVIAKEINGKAPKSIYFGLIDYDSIKDLIESKVYID